MTKTQPPGYKVIGVMSGTSLDGVDIANCTFTFQNNKWTFEVKQAETIPYPELWKKALLQLENTDGFTFEQTHVEYGFYLGELINNFIKKHQIEVDFIASHGHTIFHSAFKEPVLEKNKNKRLTVQVGAGSSIAATCKLPVVCDFRSLDVALGGQGAPLVPIGDEFLFTDYDFCLNLGGFANISYQHQGKRIAYDICPANIVMNEICKSIGKEYDENGNLAKSGKINEQLLEELNSLSFYKQAPHSPKSLGKEWVIDNVTPLLEKHKLSPEDTLCTFCEHIAIQITNSLKDKSAGRLLITGGGAFNSYLIERIKKHSIHQVQLPEAAIINFKEALIFAFLGVLRMRNETNCLESVTGAKHNSVGGAVYLG